METDTLQWKEGLLKLQFIWCYRQGPKWHKKKVNAPEDSIVSELTSKTAEGRSATFRDQGLFFRFFLFSFCLFIHFFDFFDFSFLFILFMF